MDLTKSTLTTDSVHSHRGLFRLTSLVELAIGIQSLNSRSRLWDARTTGHRLKHGTTARTDNGVATTTDGKSALILKSGDVFCKLYS